MKLRWHHDIDTFFITDSWGDNPPFTIGFPVIQSFGVSLLLAHVNFLTNCHVWKNKTKKQSCLVKCQVWILMWHHPNVNYKFRIMKAYPYHMLNHGFKRRIFWHKSFSWNHFTRRCKAECQLWYNWKKQIKCGDFTKSYGILQYTGCFFSWKRSKSSALGDLVP